MSAFRDNFNEMPSSVFSQKKKKKMDKKLSWWKGGVGGGGVGGGGGLWIHLVDLSAFCS